MISSVINDLDNFSVSDSYSCEVENCKHYLSSFTNPLTVLTQNIRSVYKNYDNFAVFQQRLNIDCDIIILTECWLNNQYNVPLIPGYSMYHTNINYNQNDGVLVYAKNHLNVSVEEPNMQDCNRLLVKIGTETAILALYRPPSFRNLSYFSDSLNDTLQCLSSFKNIIVAGDININIIPEYSDETNQNYLNLCSFHGLLPAHTLPTHQGGSCLDHIMLKSDFPSLALVINSSITDHKAVLLSLNLNLPKQSNNPIRSKLNVNKLEEYLCNVDFASVYNSDDPQLCMSFVVDNVQRGILKCSYNVSLSNKYRNIKPWITPGLIRCMRHRDKLHLKAKSNPNNSILQLSYKRYRNFCNDLLRKVKTNFDKNALEKAGINSKKIWKHIKNVTYSSKSPESSSCLLQTNASHLQSANSANSFFVNVGKCLAERAQGHLQPHLCTVFSDHNVLTSFVLLDTDEAEVERIIMSLKDDCAAGWDNITTKILKQLKHILIPPLTHIFNKCLSSGVFPACLKKAIVVPVYKSGSKDQVTNYRPISLLSSISKILEKIINKRLVNYLEDKLILSRTQFGFRPKISTADAVHHLTNYLVQELDKGKHTIGIFLDLAKAFDTVSIPILLRKLELLGIRDSQLKLFTSYLEQRAQCVRLGSVLSDEQENTSFGVPQGSILGPTLFLIYINDLCNLKLDRGTIISYADDTALLFSADSDSEVFEFAQNGFNVVNKWLQHNLLTLNAEKTNYIKFSMRDQISSTTNAKLYAHHCYSPNNAQCSCPVIKSTNQIKYLGIILDHNLSFKPHIKTLCGRVRKLIFIFKKLRHIADHYIIRQVYFALCQSILTYCITTWGGAGKTLLLTVERAQRAILKVATSRPFIFPTNLLYKSCEVLTVRQLFIMNTVLRQHAALPYSTEFTNKRRNDKVCPQPTTLKFAFVNRFYLFLGPFLYNRLNSMSNIYALNYNNCKKTITLTLQNLSYDDTEKLLDIIK